MLNERQKKLLTLLTVFGGSVENTDFMKFLFLFSQSPSSGKLYDFIPYKFGPFSFSAYEDRMSLVQSGFLLDDTTWQITQAGRMVAGKIDFFVKSFAEKFKNLRGEPLLKYVYKNYPHFAINSSILDRVAGDDDSIKNAVKKEREATGPSCSINTIGYEGHTVDSYLGRLIDSKISILCDVRKNPISRKKGFSRKSLENYCEKIKIKYIHLPELGIDSDKRQSLKSQSDYDALFSIYEQETLLYQTKILNKIGEWIDSGEIVALTCYERLPLQCHRHCVADAVCKLKSISRTNHL